MWNSINNIAIIKIFFFIIAILFLTASVPVYHPPIQSEVRRRAVSDRSLIWVRPPGIVICDHTPTTRTEVERAVSWWQALGYEFSGVHTNYLKQNCLKDNMYGIILISLVSGNNYRDGSLATTTIYSNKNTNEILWVRIELKEGLVGERVLEHELGHALGWMHSYRRGHMMNGRLSDGGWNSEGLSLIE